MFFSKSKSRKQIEQWVKTYSREMYAYSFVRLRNHEEAEDLVQSTFVKAFRFYDSFRRDADEKSWLYAILINNLKDHLRKSRKHSQTISLDSDEELKNLLIDNRESPDLMAEKSVEREILAQGIASLPEHFAAPFLLREVSDMSYKQIAELLAVPVGTVMSRLSRARKALHELFATSDEINCDTKDRDKTDAM